MTSGKTEDSTKPDDRNRPRILHCFADHGVESEALATYGNVVRIGINARDTNSSESIKADANKLPLKEGVRFDLGFFHPFANAGPALPVSPAILRNIRIRYL